MKRDQMIEGIMKSAGISKANVNRFYDGLTELARKQLLREGRFALPGLGVLRVRNRKARTGRNPQTGDPIQIKARKGVGFKPGKNLKLLLNPWMRPEEAEKPEEGEEPEEGEAAQEQASEE